MAKDDHMRERFQSLETKLDRVERKVDTAADQAAFAEAISDKMSIMLVDAKDSVKKAAEGSQDCALADQAPPFGEKLFEELLGAGEFAEPSSIGNIPRVWTTSRPTDKGLAQAIRGLEELAVEGRSEDVLRELRALLADVVASRVESAPA